MIRKGDSETLRAILREVVKTLAKECQETECEECIFFTGVHSYGPGCWWCEMGRAPRTWLAPDSSLPSMLEDEGQE